MNELLQQAREEYESTQDFTVAVEEEFAIVDPETLSLTNRSRTCKAAARGTELEPHLVGELIASEVEVRTGRCETFAEVVTRIPERRAKLRELADQLGVTLGATGTHPWSPWQEQRIIDTPHYRLRDELLRYVVWRNNSFGLHVHVAIQGADRAVKVSDGLRAYLPELLAWSASSPFVENVNTGLHSARTQIFTRFFPRCGVPDAYGDWDTFADYVGDALRDRVDLGSDGDVVERPASPRVPDGRDPHLGCAAAAGGAIALAALSYSLAVRIARAVDEGEPLLLPTNREIEENFWRAIRWGLSGDFIDLRTREVRPARVAVEELIEWVQPVAVELGTAEYLNVPEANAASARSRASRRARRSRRSTRSKSAIPWSRLVAERRTRRRSCPPRSSSSTSGR